MKEIIQSERRFNPIIEEVTTNYIDALKQLEWELSPIIEKWIRNYIGIEFVKSSLSEKQFSPSPVILFAYLLLANPDVFIESLKDDPWLIVNPVYQETIKILRSTCQYDTAKEVKFAMTLLKDAGIPVFIPKHTPRRITDNTHLRQWKSKPDDLIRLVESCISEIKPFYNPPYGRKKTERDRKKEDMAKAFEHIFESPIPEGLIFGERDKDDEAIALTFIHSAYGAPYEALKKLYYNIRKKY